MASEPPSGIASRAFAARLSRIRSRSPGTSLIAGTCPSEVRLSSMPVADGALEQADGVDDRDVDRNRLGDRSLDPVGGQEAAAQRRTALGCRLDLLGAGALSRVARRVGDLAGADEDDGEQVVEVVCDARGHPAELLEAGRSRGGRSGSNRRFRPGRVRASPEPGPTAVRTLSEASLPPWRLAVASTVVVSIARGATSVSSPPARASLRRKR